MGRVLFIHFLTAVCCWCIRPREKNSCVANIHGKAQEQARRVKEREREAAGNLSGNNDEYELKSQHTYSIYLRVIHITTVDLKLMILDFTITASLVEKFYSSQCTKRENVLAQFASHGLIGFFIC